MAITFQPFDRNRPVRIYRRYLPHWRQDGATYFVTLRLHDSLPAYAIEQLEVLRQMLARHGDRDEEQGDADRAYFQKMKHFLDEGHGACWLREPAVAAMVGESVGHFDGMRYEAGEVAVLPNHMHVVLRPLPGFELEEILHTWKSFSAKAINRHLGRFGTVWQHESYDRLVRDSDELRRTERYIRNNLLPLEQHEMG